MIVACSIYPRLFGKEVLVDLAVLHDNDKVLGRILDELNVFQGVAIHEDKVPESTPLRVNA